MTPSPEEVRSKRFTRAWPGFHEREVATYLGEIADELARGTVGTGDDRFLEAGREVAGALRSLHDSLVEVRREGEREAEEVVRRAHVDATAERAEAEEVLRRAREEADAVRAEAEQEAERRRAEADAEAEGLRELARGEVEEARRTAASALREAHEAVAEMKRDQRAKAEVEVARLVASRRDEIGELEARQEELRLVESDLRQHLAEVGRRLTELGEAVGTPAPAVGAAEGRPEVLDLRDPTPDAAGGPEEDATPDRPSTVGAGPTDAPGADPADRRPPWPG